MKIVNNLMGQGAKQICTRGFEIHYNKTFFLRLFQPKTKQPQLKHEILVPNTSVLMKF